jgi:hypothetical protein
MLAPVPTTAERNADPPICFGHIDRSTQVNLRNLLRPDTPAHVRVKAESAED